MVNVADTLSTALTDELFPAERQLLPDLKDIYELELAFYENKLLTDEELLRNGAYFARVGNSFTRHYLMCTGHPLKLPQHSSSRLKSFFEKNVFRTGYGTHGLFPYRGKFHPQMIKGLMNVMGLKPGEVVLDPMMGSGTVLVEAALMGIESIGVDASPFCRFMARTKVDALTLPLGRVHKALSNFEEVYQYFQNRVGKANAGTKTRRSAKSQDFMTVMEPAAEYVLGRHRKDLTTRQEETSKVYNFLLLAYLDSAGYAERSTRQSPVQQFKAILDRYFFVAEKIQNVLNGAESDLARATTIEGDARSLPIEDSSVDGIVFSPPYSFAIDYLQNDSFHLNFLGVGLEDLRQNMIGLRGRKLADKFEFYKEDMDKVLSECARLLRPGRICTIVVGTNNNQLGKILELPPDEVPGLHETLTEMASGHGFRLIKQMSRPITGISNTMRREYILMLQKG
jgi:ubiquinone/menaquinone biosynthesis C-methylase UbiE